MVCMMVCMFGFDMCIMLMLFCLGVVVIVVMGIVRMGVCGVVEVFGKVVGWLLVVMGGIVWQLCSCVLVFSLGDLDD